LPTVRLVEAQFKLGWVQDSPLAGKLQEFHTNESPAGAGPAGRKRIEPMTERDQFTVSTKYWHKLEDGRIQCDLCPRFCKLHTDQRGLCYVRQNLDNEIVLTTYGRSSGYCIDPIEKKPLNHFLPGTPVLSFGTAGCNLACKFCQNWDISKSRETHTLTDAASPALIADAAEQLNCRSVAYTYNDPVIFHEYAIDVARACHEKGIKSVAVTAGYVCPEPRREFYRYMDAANVDLKAFTEDFYHKITGSHLAPVLETLEYIKHETSTWLELTTLLIPGKNDSEKELHEMTGWVVDRLGPDVPMHFSAFHPDWKMMDVPATPKHTLVRAREIAMNNGVRYAYTGNVHNAAGDSTYCHHCGELLIGRDWYVLTAWKLTADGTCSACGTPCAGVFETGYGNWGAKRQPVQLRDFAI
jgi:pyruvate formate lyase activating enzyme